MDDLSTLAQGYLEDLLTDSGALPPPSVDEQSSPWAEEFLGAIRRHRTIHPDGEARAAAQRFGRSSTQDRYRFFWEAWQNADDAEADTLRFYISATGLVVENTGKHFTTRDAYSVCFVGSSQKVGRIDKKGQYGIGFLSLMRVCAEPVIHSGPFHLRLRRDYTYPEQIDGCEFFAGIRIEAALDSDVDVAELREELVSRLDDEVLLYMSHLRRIEVVDEVIGETWSVAASGQLSSSGARAVTIGEHTWLQYRVQINADPTLRREDGEPVPEQLPIVLARSESVGPPHRLSSFFPTNVLHDLPWRFSAPFEVTNNRGELLPSKYNKWLLERVGEVMVQAATDPKVGDRKAPWRLIPGSLPTNRTLAPLYEAAHAKLRMERWIPTGRGRRRPDEVALPVAPEVRELIQPSEIPLDNVKRRYWIAGEVTGEEESLLADLGAFPVCCHKLSLVLATGPSRSPLWYLRAVAETIRLARERGVEIDGVFSRLLDGDCFKDQNGSAFCLARAGRDGKVVTSTRSNVLAGEIERFASPFLILLHQVYRPPEHKRSDPHDPLRERVHEWLRTQAGERTYRYEFRLDAPQFIRRFIVEARPEWFASLDGATHDYLLAFIRAHFPAYASEYRDAKLGEIGSKIKVEAFSVDSSGRRVQERRPLAGVYLGKSFTESKWSDAASEVPGIWWLASRYRNSLRQVNATISLPEFLRRLGVAEVPGLIPLGRTGWHGSHSFYRVYSGDAQNAPNFPHDKAQGYTEYGLRNDYTCPDLEAVLYHLQSLPDSERDKRGQALLRALEQHWDHFSKHTQASAHGYRANGEFDLGQVPTRWRHALRTRPWVRFGDGEFRAPAGRYARTEAVLDCLSTKDPEVCVWRASDAAVATALGLSSTVPAAGIVRRLERASQGGVNLTVLEAARFYTALAQSSPSGSSSISILKQRDLIYFPKGSRKWWPPDLCFTTNQEHIFGDHRAYLVPYREASRLWAFLGIEAQPSLRTLLQYWEEIAGVRPGDQVLKRLTESYRVAEPLCAKTSERAVIRVWTDRGWRQSNGVVATHDEELWEALGSPLPRWLQPDHTAFRALANWARITLLEEDVEYGSPLDEGDPDPDATRVLRSGVARLVNEIPTGNPELWKKIARAAEGWLAAGVRRVENLQLPVSVRLPRVGLVSQTVTRRARYDGSTLYLSALAEAHDREAVASLLSEAALTELERFHLQDALRLRLLDAATDHDDTEVTVEFPDGTDGDQLDMDLFNESDPPGGEQSTQSSSGGDQNQNRPPTPQPKPPAPPVPPPTLPPPPDVDEFEKVEEVTGNPGPTDGGPVPPDSVDPKPPRRGTGTSSYPTRYSLANRSVEQRGVDIVKRHVLLEGVRVSDQRLHAGVGADLVCDDGYFRELKVYSGAAPARIRLTKHEHARSLASADRYELVIVEHVWDAPRITIIRNPLRALRYRPAGDVEVLNWTEPGKQFRVIQLQKPSTPSTQSDGSEQSA